MEHLPICCRNAVGARLVAIGIGIGIGIEMIWAKQKTGSTKVNWTVLLQCLQPISNLMIWFICHGTGQKETGAYKYYLSNLSRFAMPQEGIRLF